MITDTHGTRTSVQLYCRAADGIGLHDALARAPLAGAVALLSTPDTFVIATVRDDGRCATADADAHLGEVFEARVFVPDAELRWTATAPGSGRAVLLAENPALLPADPFSEDVAALEAVDIIEARYLLWGRPVDHDPAPDGWTALHTPRIGTLRVPAPRPAPDERMQLVAREYVATEPRHGNAYICEERLLYLEAARPERRGKPHG
ncbi:CRISPR-associated protein Csx19 [Streptomyces sp. NPDC002742]|uniref:type III-D CRISPR-associated protein Csx19 n=1 Tax=Streptomyces sp. NPDC002742 TaxID=3364663 RepID=UPI0036A02A7B